MGIQWTHSTVFIIIVGARVCNADRAMGEELGFLKALYFQREGERINLPLGRTYSSGTQKEQREEKGKSPSRTCGRNKKGSE